MAKPPEFTRNNDDQFRIQASFPGGRYHFSLSPAAVGLLRDLNYTPGDTVPWDMFNCLAIIGDAWLPNTNDDFIDDLSNPESPPPLNDSETKELAEYISDRKVTSSERERLEELLEDSLLGQHLDLDSMNSTAEWVAETSDLVTDNSPTAVDDSESSPEAATVETETDSSCSILHVGKLCLGRRNMGRAKRRYDYHKTFSQVVTIAIKRNVDLVVSAGGLFQRSSPDQSTVSTLQSELSTLGDANIPFFYVRGPKENNMQSRLRAVESSSILTHVAGEPIEPAPGIVIGGIDAAKNHDIDPLCTETVAGADFLIILCGTGDVVTQPSKFTSHIESLPADPDICLSSSRTDAAQHSPGSTTFIDPGCTEHILGKSTIDDSPPPRRVYEYRVEDGELTITHHELYPREYTTFEFEITPQTALEDIQAQVAKQDLEDTAVLARLSGEDINNPSKKAVANMLNERSYCVRVYDERTTGTQKSTDTTSDSEQAQCASAPESTETIARMLARLRELKQGEQDDIAEQPTEQLVDWYVLFSAIKSVSEQLRQEMRDELESRANPEQSLTGRFGTVQSTLREQQLIKDNAIIKSVLNAHDLPLSTIQTQTIDREKLEQVISTDEVEITEDDVYDTNVSTGIRRDEVDLSSLDRVEDRSNSNSADRSNQLNSSFTHSKTEQSEKQQNNSNSDTSQVYLGEGAGPSGWIELPRRIVLDDIAPLVADNQIENESSGIKVNFSKDIPISGWNTVNEKIVSEEIVPIVQEDRR